MTEAAAGVNALLRRDGMRRPVEGKSSGGSRKRARVGPVFRFRLPPSSAHVAADVAAFLPGHHGALNQQHVMPSQAFQMRRALPPDDIQDDFDWDSIV